MPRHGEARAAPGVWTAAIAVLALVLGWLTGRSGSDASASHAQRTHGVHVGATLGAIAGLACTVILVCAVVYGLATHWEVPMAGPNAAPALDIAGPTLQSAPRRDSAAELARQADSLQRLQWLDPAKGAARIPIDDAMRLIAQGRASPHASPDDASPGGAAPKDAADQVAPSTDTPSNDTPPNDTRPEDATRSYTPPPAHATPAGALDPSGSAAPDVTQRLGAMLPLDARFRDEAGVPGTLARYFDDVPVVLVFGYYRCPNLCSTLMENVLVSLSAARIGADAYRVLAISVDPRERPSDAAAKAQAYRAIFEDAPLHLLTGEGAQSARVAHAAGLRFAYDPLLDQYAHPLALLVVSREGRVSRYFGGVQFDPEALRLALVEASSGTIGSFTDRVFLRCAHFDPQTGRYTVAAIDFVRGGSLLCAGAVAAWVWRRRRRAA